MDKKDVLEELREMRTEAERNMKFAVEDKEAFYFNGRLTTLNQAIAIITSSKWDAYHKNKKVVHGK